MAKCLPSHDLSVAAVNKPLYMLLVLDIYAQEAGHLICSSGTQTIKFAALYLFYIKIEMQFNRIFETDNTVRVRLRNEIRFEFIVAFEIQICSSQSRASFFICWLNYHMNTAKTFVHIQLN